MSITNSVLKSLILGVLVLGLLSACSAAVPAAGSSAEPTTAVVSVGASSTAATSDATTASSATDATAAMIKLNLNMASSADFLTIPGVGDRMVREFMEYRPYTSIQQFEREIGKYVSDDQVAAYEQYVYVPISVNDADEATLMQIPGLDTAAAQALMAARPYDSNEAFLSALSQYVSADSLAIAGTYLDTP